MRWISALALAAAIGLVMSMAIATDADAQKAKASKFKNKMCTGTELVSQKKVSFKCKAEEKCCFDAVLGKGNCVAAGGVCL